MSLEKTTARLKAIVDAFTQLAQTTHQLQDNGDSRKLVQSQLNGILGLLSSIPEGASGEDEEVSIDLIRSLDFGKHPDAWLREQLDEMRRAQKDCQAKAQGLETFRSMLTQQLADILPVPTGNVAIMGTSPTADDDIIVD